jgi:hypothetical protein
MPTYEYSPEGNADLKKTWARTMVAYYTVILIVFTYNLLYKNGTALNIGIFVVIVAALGAGYWFGRKKYFAITDSTRLVVTDYDITLQVIDRPDITIAFANIKDLKHRKDGIYLQSNIATKPSLLISNKFSDFYEIERLLTNKVHENQ